MFDDGWSLYGPNFTVTASGALQGFLWGGNLLAITLAVLVVLIPPIEGLATQLAILSYCTPLLALGPIILVVFGGRTPHNLSRRNVLLLHHDGRHTRRPEIGRQDEPRSRRRLRRWAFAEVHQSSTCERTSEHLCCPQDCCTFGRTGCNSR